MRPEAQAGLLIIPIDHLAQLEPPFAIQLVGRHPRLPIYLHVDRNWDFRAVAGRCGRGDRAPARDGRGCAVRYREHRDRFECACDGAEYRSSGRPFGRSVEALATYPVLYRDEFVLVDLGGSPGR